MFGISYLDHLKRVSKTRENEVTESQFSPGMQRSNFSH